MTAAGKRFSVYGLVALVAVTLFYSCSASLTNVEVDKKKTVALIVRMKHGDYWRTVKLGAEMAAKEYERNLNFYAPDYEEDAQRQMELVHQAIADGSETIVVAPSDEQVLREAIKLTRERAIPILVLDTDGKDSAVKSYIGTDNYDMGKKAFEKMVYLIGKKGQIALLGTNRVKENAKRREQGVLDLLPREMQVELVANENVPSDKKQIGEWTRELIRKHPQLKGVIALDATTAIGVAEEMENSGLRDNVKIVAIDSPLEVLEYLQEGIISATIIQKPLSMGYLGVKYAVEASDGEAVPSLVDTGTKVIDRENMFWSENQKLLFPFVK
ncbi:substrate-binding domain-containing protein [Brevibacillus formosus]|uniref:ABC transporter substrate-binding protein n=1 Tax=Brevibacillus formosus TaxID=54913 RepID=A0A837KJ27_9BACL|nr:substrate-binding domain-containing protein [Brevibacillus formosus]KLH97438.1 ABC transporter substrate-binding protein [Brevibacillus formosus]MED1958231.1 substrate-binding domain-containing protein [Brevibacillus formosus]PSJ87960.1 ABC transporter substrate-binding protein [Brevibacillus formosus]GED59915.1 sugar ABC transporter substrate-binding protein [Brevibacillus formosus]